MAPDQFNILDQSLNYLETNKPSAGQATVHRDLVTSNGTQTSQLLRLAYFTATRAETVTQVDMATAGTPAGATPTLIRVGLWTVDSTSGALLALVANTASDTALLAAANTLYTKALAASYTFIPGQRYAGGLLVVTAATAPSVAGGATGTTTATHGYAPVVGMSLGSQTDLPATASPTAGSLRPYLFFRP